MEGLHLFPLPQHLTAHALDLTPVGLNLARAFLPVPYGKTVGSLEDALRKVLAQRNELE